MLDRKAFVEKNLLRLVAIPFILGAVGTASYSTYQHEKSSNPDKNGSRHPFFDMTSALIGCAIICNALGRANDHKPYETLRKNIPWAFIATAVQMAQIACSVASASNAFEQPITLPPALQSLTILTFSLLNWKPVPFTQENHYQDRLKKNWARILGATVGSVSGGIALTSMVSDQIPIQRAYFAAAMLGSLAGVSESSQRCIDILYFDAEKHNLFNKINAVLFMLTAVANTTMSALMTFTEIVALPDAANFLFAGAHMLFLMFAQFTFNIRPQTMPIAQSLNDDDRATVVSVIAEDDDVSRRSYVPPVIPSKEVTEQNRHEEDGITPSPEPETMAHGTSHQTTLFSTLTSGPNSARMPYDEKQTSGLKI